MRILRSTTAPAFVLALVLAACGGGTASPAASEADAAAESAAASAPASAATPSDGGSTDGGDGPTDGDAAASVEVNVTGGEFEGDYSGSVPDGGCSRGATGENTFGLQYSTDQDVELSSVQLIVDDAEAAAGGTDAFLTTFTFGDLLEGTQLEVQPSEENGSGTVTLDDRGDTATITIDVETADGTAIAATVECHTVFDFGG